MWLYARINKYHFQNEYFLWNEFINDACLWPFFPFSEGNDSIISIPSTDALYKNTIEKYTILLQILMLFHEIPDPTLLLAANDEQS